MATTLTFGLNSFILNLDAHFYLVFIYIYIWGEGGERCWNSSKNEEWAVLVFIFSLINFDW